MYTYTRLLPRFKIYAVILDIYKTFTIIRKRNKELLQNLEKTLSSRKNLRILLPKF